MFIFCRNFFSLLLLLAGKMRATVCHKYCWAICHLSKVRKSKNKKKINDNQWYGRFVMNICAHVFTLLLVLLFFFIYFSSLAKLVELAEFGHTQWMRFYIYGHIYCFFFSRELKFTALVKMLMVIYEYEHLSCASRQIKQKPFFFYSVLILFKC